jgi:hypothetical protein
MHAMTQEEVATLPHVVFYTEGVEDREATIAAGHFVAKDVHMVKVTARGTKDNVQKQVSDWFESLKALHAGGRISDALMQNWKEAYESWKKGEEIPESGMSIRNWPVATPAQVKTLTAMHVLTVEQLASANEQIIAGLGLHGRTLHQRAQAYLKSATTVGRPVLLMEKLEKENADLKETVESLLGQIAELKKAIPAAPAK